ncbi:MAG: preprotein translocase subunit SecE [Gammaproteobacteria bacterium]
MSRDYFLWALAMLAAGVVLVSDAMLEWESNLYRVLTLTGCALVIAGILALTTQGVALINLLSDSRDELRKVHWPTRAETGQMTLLVMLVITVLGLLLWALDYLLGWAISWILG